MSVSPISVPPTSVLQISVSRRALCVAYGAIAVLALIGTWGNNFAYSRLGLGFLDLNVAFWRDTLANPASRSITVDIFFLSLAINIWIVLEARRLAMRGVWLYFLFGVLIAISVTVPIFLINRERAMIAAKPSEVAGSLYWADVAGFVAVGLAVIAYAAIALIHGSS